MATSQNTSDTSDTAKKMEKPSKTTRRIPRILADLPELSVDGAMRLDLHKRHHVQDAKIAHPVTGDPPDDPAAEVQRHYAYMAKIDPSSATFDPPAHTLSPMPIGGLGTLANHLLGPRPVVPAHGMATDEQVKAANQYDQDHETLVQLLYRLNTDQLRDDNRYKAGQLVRVPSEIVDA